jgi:Uncharacterised nucleotidyltransferase
MTSSIAVRVVPGVAGYGLPGATPVFPPAPLDSEAWGTVFTSVLRHRITGHLVQVIHDDVFPATDDQQAAAVEAHERALALALILERFLLATVADLDVARITTRVLRGAAVAHTVYPEPSLRSFGDIDLLVARPDYDAAVTLLCARGARRRYPEPRPGFDRRFGKGVCLEASDGLEIDLHQTLTSGPFGLAVDVDALFGPGSEFSLGGRTLVGLDPEARFLDACFHSALGNSDRRLVALRDVAQMALCSPLDVGRLRRLCRLWRCGIVVERAIALAWKAFTLDATPEIVRWARAHECTAFERRALHSYLSADQSYARQAVAGLYALRGWRDKVRYTATLLVPTRPYVRAREGSYLRRAGRALHLSLEDRSTRRPQASATRGWE